MKTFRKTSHYHYFNCNARLIDTGGIVELFHYVAVMVQHIEKNISKKLFCVHRIMKAKNTF